VEKYDFVTKIKGKGFMVGLELAVPGSEVVEKAFQNGLVINCTSGNVLRFVPPMVITREEIDEFINILDTVFSEMK